MPTTEAETINKDLLAFFQQPAGKYPPQTTKTWAVTP